MIKASATDKQAFAAMVQKLTVVTIVLAFLFPLMVRFLRKPDFIWGVQRKHKPVSLFLLTLLTTFVVIVCLSSITKQAHEAFDIAKLTAENTRLQKNIAKAAKLAEEREAGILRATQAHESIKVNLDDQIASLKAQMAELKKNQTVWEEASHGSKNEIKRLGKLVNMTGDKVVLSSKIETLNTQLKQLQEEQKIQRNEFQSKLNQSENSRVAAEENFKEQEAAREAKFEQEKEQVLSSIKGMQEQNSYTNNRALGVVAATAKSLELFSMNGNSMKRH